MGKRGTTLISAIVIGLLAGSAVGVAAQDAEVDATAPVEFIGATRFGPSGGDFGINPIAESFTDPRLAGEFRVWQNNDVYPGGPTLFMGGFSMHDDEGGWVQRPSFAINHPDGTSATRVIVMDGQGAYEGLTLVAEVSLANRRWDWHGYIVDGELPPAPTIALPE